MFLALKMHFFPSSIFKEFKFAFIKVLNKTCLSAFFTLKTEMIFFKNDLHNKIKILKELKLLGLNFIEIIILYQIKQEVNLKLLIIYIIWKQRLVTIFFCCYI